MSLDNFLEFWQSPPNYALADPIRRIYHAFVEVDANLYARKSEAHKFVIPGKDSRGRWVPIFDPDQTDTIANLASEIDQARANLKSISNDIEEICLLAGRPTMMDLQKERETLLRSISLAESTASSLAKRAYAGNPQNRPRPEEVAELPEIKEAYGKADALRQEHAPRIEELTAKLEKIREISEKYPD